MQIVIDIDENLYTRLFDNGVDNYDDAADIAKAIRKGTPLPKHGKLKDINKIYDKIDALNRSEEYKGKYTGVLAILTMADTIIESDKEC